MFIIVFGLAGSGKNYVGEILAKDLNGYFWDADTLLTQGMRSAIKNHKSFTSSMRDTFTSSLIGKIHELRESHAILVVSQALYKEKNRIEIKTSFPDALFLHVEANLTVRLERIDGRQKGIKSDYLLAIESNFESPNLPHQSLLNNDIGEKAIHKQLYAIKNNWGIK